MMNKEIDLSELKDFQPIKKTPKLNKKKEDDFLRKSLIKRFKDENHEFCSNNNNSHDFPNQINFKENDFEFFAPIRSSNSSKILVNNKTKDNFQYNTLIETLITYQRILLLK